ncbi:hypothetical protein OROMI_032746 [Orobanche minor]
MIASVVAVSSGIPIFDCFCHWRFIVNCIRRRCFFRYFHLRSETLRAAVLVSLSPTYSTIVFNR